MSHAERELRILGHLMVIEDHLAGKFVSEGDGGELQVTIGGSTSSTGKIPSDDMKVCHRCLILIRLTALRD